MTVHNSQCTSLLKLCPSTISIASVTISVSGQLSETFRLPIKSQAIFIARTSGLLHSIARCLVSLETEFQFRDVLRRKMTLKVLEHAIDELLDNEMNYRMALLLYTL